jgi:hypothetical protein
VKAKKDRNQVALAVMEGSESKESFKDLPFTKQSASAPN